MSLISPEHLRQNLQRHELSVSAGGSHLEADPPGVSREERSTFASALSGRGSLLKRLLSTGDDPVALGLRLTLGLVMLPHGLQKTLGLFGGYGFEGTMGFFTGVMHIPWPFALAAILAESVGALALVLGLFGRIAALGIAANMVVAALTSHLANGFFMNWFGQQKGEGFEYHLLALAIALAVVVRGSGRASLDRWLARR